MNRTMQTFAVALLAFFAQLQASQQSIAVLDFEARGVEPHEAAIIADRFRGQLVKSGAFTVMERGQMEAVLKEQGFQQSGACTDASCVVEMGQMLSVTSIITGSVGKIGSMYTIDAKMIDIRTGQIRMTLSEDVKGAVEDVLTVAVPAMCDKLIRDVLSSALTVGYLDISSSPAGAMVKLDGSEVGTTPVKGLEAEAGNRQIDVSLDGYASQNRTAQVLKGQSQSFQFSLSPTSEHLAAQKEQAGLKRKKTGKALRIAGAVLAAAGVGATTYFWLNASSSYDEYAAGTDPDALGSMWDDTQSSSTYGNITAIIGAAGAIVLGVSFAF